jgi:hypothetical protein
MSGALQWQELMQIATGIGFAPPILVKSVVFESDNPKVTEFLGITSSILYGCVYVCLIVSWDLTFSISWT